MAASNVPHCLLCASLFPDSKQRRNVNQGEGLLLKAVLKDLLAGCLKDNEKLCLMDYDSGSCNSGNHDLFNDEVSSDYLQLSNVVCKGNCFTSLNKLVKLTKDLEELNEKLQAQVVKSFYQFRSTRTVQRPQKRPNAGNDCSPAQKKLKKECTNTPTRKFLNSVVVDDGSSTAVSILVYQ